MNEQIRKLYEQANIRHTNDYALSGKPREEWRSIPDLFAELIAKQAVECVSDLMRDEQSALTYTAGAEVQARLREYFGIK